MNKIKAIIVALTLLTGSLGMAVTDANSSKARSTMPEEEVPYATEETAVIPSSTPMPGPSLTPTPVPTEPEFFRSSESAIVACEYEPDTGEQVEINYDEIEIPEIVLGDINDKENVHIIAAGAEVSIADMLAKVTPIPTKVPEESSDPAEGEEDKPKEAAQSSLFYTRLGIDVSAFQENIDWNTVAASGVKFAMVRVGYRGYGTGRIVADPKVYQNIEGALAAGIEVGVYFFSQAVTEEEAVQEAAWTCKIIEGYNITYPVAFDFEEWYSHPDWRIYNINRNQANRNARAFMDYVKSKGYTPCLYGGKSDFRWFWNQDLFADCYIWLAYYASDLVDDYEGRHSMWQYTGKGRVPGISTYVDMDIEYCYGTPDTGTQISEEITGIPDIPTPEVTPPAETLENNAESFVVSAEFESVNVYESADDGENAVILGTLEAGTTVLATAFSEDWSVIEFNGVSAYVRSSALTQEKSPESEETEEGEGGEPIEELPEPEVTPEAVIEEQNPEE